MNCLGIAGDGVVVNDALPEVSEVMFVIVFQVIGDCAKLVEPWIV